MEYFKDKNIGQKVVCNFIFFYFIFFAFISNASGTSANLSGTSCSLTLGYTSFYIDQSLLQIYFTTYDGDRYSLPYYYDDGLIYPNNELKKVSSLYKTDYYIISSGYIDDYGEISLDLNSSDSNENGIDDVCEKSLYFNSSITGNWYSEDGASGAIGGTFNKNADLQEGTYTLILYTSGGALNLSGVYYVGTLAGTITYNPSSHSVEVNYSTFFDIENVGESFSTTYAVIDANHIRLDAQGYFPTTTFTRNGSLYSSIVTLTDGNPDTFWTDYETWYISIQDNNDTDDDGIPDFSDTCPIGPSWKCVKGLPWIMLLLD